MAQKEAIEEQEAKLQGEKEALDELQASVTQKQNEVSALADSTSGQISQHVNEIAQARRLWTARTTRWRTRRRSWMS